MTTHLAPNGLTTHDGTRPACPDARCIADREPDDAVAYTPAEREELGLGGHIGTVPQRRGKG